MNYASYDSIEHYIKSYYLSEWFDE